jgi:hypothetical protein
MHGGPFGTHLHSLLLWSWNMLLSRCHVAPRPPDLQCAQAIVESLKSRHILISTMAPGVLRLVTHLDVGDQDIDAVVQALQQLAASGEGKAAAADAIKAVGGVLGTQGGQNGAGGCGYGASPAAVASGAAAPGASAGTGTSE